MRSPWKHAPLAAIPSKEVAMQDIDITKIDQLITRFETSSLSRLKLRSGDLSLTLERATKEEVAPVAVTSPITASASNQSAVSKSDETLETIVSPIVGTFYLTPAVDAPPYVRAGSVVVAGDILCTIEAMKLMNHLEAEYACEIVEILAEPEQMVEFGAPLFKVRKL